MHKEAWLSEESVKVGSQVSLLSDYQYIQTLFTNYLSPRKLATDSITAHIISLLLMNLTVRTATSCCNDFSGGSIRTDTGILAIFNRILLAPLKLHLQERQINTNSRFYAAICNYPAPHPVISLELFHPGATIPIHHPAQSSGATSLD